MQPTLQKTQLTQSRQDGAALFTALVFLLILTILGVFGMNISRLENQMAGNSQFQTTALNHAEYVLVRGEEKLQEIVGAGTNPFLINNSLDQYYCADPHCNPTLADDIDVTDPVWAFSSQKVSIPDVNGDGHDTDGDGTPDDGTGFYVITDAGFDNSSGECEEYPCSADPPPGAKIQIFQVTAKSESARGANRIVQSVYVLDPLPVIGATP
jgi:Tfp pilus assembly protein PilX